MGPALMERMQKHAERFETKLIYDHVQSVDLRGKPFTLTGDQGTYTCDALIITTGASAKYLGIPQRARLPRQGCIGLCDLRRLLLQGPGCRGDRRRQYGRRRGAVPRQYCEPRHTSCNRRDKFKGEKILHDKLFKKAAEGKVEIVWNSHLTKCWATLAALPGMRVKNLQDGTTRELALKGVFVAIGHEPNTKIFDGQLAMNGGYIKVKSGNEGERHRDQCAAWFAAGDVMDHVYRRRSRRRHRCRRRWTQKNTWINWSACRSGFSRDLIF